MNPRPQNLAVRRRERGGRGEGRGGADGGVRLNPQAPENPKKTLAPPPQDAAGEEEDEEGSNGLMATYG